LCGDPLGVFIRKIQVLAVKGVDEGLSNAGWRRGHEADQSGLDSLVQVLGQSNGRFKAGGR